MWPGDAKINNINKQIRNICVYIHALKYKLVLSVNNISGISEVIYQWVSNNQ